MGLRVDDVWLRFTKISLPFVAAGSLGLQSLVFFVAGGLGSTVKPLPFFLPWTRTFSCGILKFVPQVVVHALLAARRCLTVGSLLFFENRFRNCAWLCSVHFLLCHPAVDSVAVLTNTPLKNCEQWLPIAGGCFCSFNNIRP